MHKNNLNYRYSKKGQVVCTTPNGIHKECVKTNTVQYNEMVQRSKRVNIIGLDTLMIEIAKRFVAILRT